MFMEGDRGESVIVIRAGRVKVFATSNDGHGALLAIRGPGDVLGEFSALDDGPRSASGTALERVDAQVISSVEFRRFLAEVPGAAFALLVAVVGRIRTSDRLRVELGARDTLGRVALRLLELAETTGEEVDGSLRITLPLTQDDLASWVAASREAVARALASLRRRGIITTARREIRVLDLAALRDTAG